MEKKRIAILAVFSVLIASGIVFYFLVYQQAQIQGNVILGNNTNNETATDPHGCFIHYGFSWNETQQECVRNWISVNQSARYQKNFVPGNETLNFSSNETVNWTTYVTVANITNPNPTNETNISLTNNSQ